MNRRLTGAARVAGVTGWPVKHSLSPRLHGYWLDRYGIDGAYLPFPVAPENFERAVRGLRDAGVRGLNVTVPHKLAAHQLADRLDAAATAIGAVNLLVFHDDGSIEGRNTDAYGFLENLRSARVDVTVGPVLMIGAGGAARAALHALLEAGAPEVRIVNRTETTVSSLVDDTGDARVRDAGRTVETADINDITLVINTTSLGMNGKGSIPLDMAALPGDAVIHDIVYVPLETDLLGRARAAGRTTVDGLGMLLHQAVPSFEAFFGIRPDVDDRLRSDLLEAL